VSRFQQGSLFRLERRTRPDVWVFRWYDNTSGKRTYRKKIIGSVAQLRNRREAEMAVVVLRSSINVDAGTPQNICDLAAPVVSAILCKCRSSGCGPVVGAGSFLLVTLMPGWLELFGRRGPPSRPSRSEFILSLDGGPGLPYRFSPGMGVTRITLRSRS